MGYSQDEEVHLHYENQTISHILDDLEASYGLEFTFGKIPLERATTFEYQGRLDQALATFFSDQGILFKKIGDHIVLKADTPKGQPIKGIITDVDSKMPLVGANVIVVGSTPLIGTSTDDAGFFSIKDLKVGRYDLYIEYLGYDATTIKQILVTTGKEQFILADLRESTLLMQEVVVTAKFDASKPLNEMVTNSARSFSVEETSRYAAAISDPARMAQSYAGVTGNGDDLTNEIIIRGNSSRGLLWRIEGVEIPNPSHFSDLGATGGNISMLSASTLTNSDFYTGAFPAEFGNAISGVFDLKMRNGNNEKREHALQIGTLGMEASSEGYFTKSSPASYLFNYRYSTIALIKNLLPSLSDQVHPFQDLSFKINLPTKKAGVFSLFGLGGTNSTETSMGVDTSDFVFNWQLQEFEVQQSMGVMGLSNQYIFSDKWYLRTSLTTSKWNYDDETTQLQPSNKFRPVVIDVTTFNENETILSAVLNFKANASSVIRTGFNLRQKHFDYDYKSFADADTLLSFLENSGTTQFVDAYAQWKFRYKEDWEINAGINASCLLLNKSVGIDPRIGIKYLFKNDQTVSIATGLYSKPDHLSTYFIERRHLNGATSLPNFNLPMLKAFHLVSAYSTKLRSNLQLKIEGYYQSLFDIPVSANASSIFSVLNASSVFGVIFLNDQDGASLLPEGTGENYGLEITLERFFSDGLYYLFTASLFDSKFTTINKRKFHSRYATNYVTNLLGGKEWTVGTRKKNAVGLNGKFTWQGGLRSTPILLAESLNAGTTVIDTDRYNTMRNPDYYRLDLGIFYRINSPKTTHWLKLDVQNVTDRQNIAERFFDPIQRELNNLRQNGLIPFINYRMEF